MLSETGPSSNGFGARFGLLAMYLGLTAVFGGALLVLSRGDVRARMPPFLHVAAGAFAITVLGALALCDLGALVASFSQH